MCSETPFPLKASGRLCSAFANHEPVVVPAERFVAATGQGGALLGVCGWRLHRASPSACAVADHRQNVNDQETPR